MGVLVGSRPGVLVAFWSFITAWRFVGGSSCGGPNRRWGARGHQLQHSLCGGVGLKLRERERAKSMILWSLGVCNDGDSGFFHGKQSCQSIFL